jgi:chorismate--pyruvate lyase
MPPPHSDPWRPWLTYPGSLTWRIVARCRRFEVEVVRLGVRLADEEEYRAIGRPGSRLLYVREVVLRADGVAVVSAMSILPYRDLQGVWRSVAGLGNRPLAEVLFADRRVRREPFEFAPGVPARRSLFRLRGHPLRVTEAFLPALLDLDR